MKTKNLAVGILAGVLLVALWYTMLLKPTRTKVTEVKAEAQVQEDRLAPLQSQLAQARADAANAAQIKAQLASLQEAMPDTPALAEFIREANRTATGSGVAWQSVTHATPTPGVGGSTSITVGIQVRGTYGQVLDYLGRLASMKRLLVVDNLQLATGSSGATAGDANAGAQSTGPFSGGDELSATISARMFSSPAAVAAAAGVGSTGAPQASAASSSAPASSGGSTLNNS
jgi:Tfp pilus assembly protein PilO